MSFNAGYPSDRAALLSGLRARSSSPVPGYGHGQGQGQQPRQNNVNMHQSLEDLQQMMLQQQMQFQQQPLAFMAPPQHQPSHQAQVQAQAQAQLFALQQSQIELQLQQIKMANLALQEQILLQHQQQVTSPPPPSHLHHHQQQQQQQRSISASCGNLGRQAGGGAGYNSNTTNQTGDEISQWASYHQQQTQQQQSYPNTAHSLSHLYGTQADGLTNCLPDHSGSQSAGPELSADARHEARRGALQNLQQARQQRVHSPSPSISSATFSPPPPAVTALPPATTTPASGPLDWQAQRMQYKQQQQQQHTSDATTASTPESVVTPPAQTDSHKRLVLITEQASSQQHRKNNISDASSASIQSLSISEAGSQFSPNRGPALILSKPGDEFPEDEDEDGKAGDDSAADDSGPISPSLSASLRAASIHGVLSVATDDVTRRPERRRSSSSGRHTVILSSTISDPLAGQILRQYAAPAASTAVGGRDTPSAESDGASSSSSSSSAASSPTSDKSEVASFESSHSTVGTSVVNTSPTSSSFDKEVEVAITPGGVTPLSAPGHAAHRRVVSAAVGSSGPAVVLNPGAATFAPGHTKNYPSSLSVCSSAGGTGTNTPLRMFSAPARTSTPGSGSVVVRQPKGPADEKDMPSKNFAGMIRRRAVGALRLAAHSGVRASPLSSPVLPGFSGAFGGDPSAAHMGLSRLSSPPHGLSSPLASQTTFNMSDLASRAMRRRSQQGGYATLSGDFGLGVTQ